MHSILGYKGWGTLCSGLYRLRGILYWAIRVVARTLCSGLYRLGGILYWAIRVVAPFVVGYTGWGAFYIGL